MTTCSNLHRCDHAPEAPVTRASLTEVHRANRRELLAQIAHYRASALDVLRAQQDRPNDPLFVPVDPRMLLALCECADIVQGLVFSTLAADPAIGPHGETSTGGPSASPAPPGTRPPSPLDGCDHTAR